MDSWRDARQAGRVSPFGHLRITALLPAPRSFSQAHAPFVASHRLGIHRMRLFAWPYNPNRPGRGATRAAFSASLPPPPPSRAGAATSPSSPLCFSIPHAPARPAPWPGAPPRASPKLLKTARGANAPRPRHPAPAAAAPPHGDPQARRSALAARRAAKNKEKNPHTQHRPAPRPNAPPRWWSQGGSNSRPPACKAGALPAELWPLRAAVGGQSLVTSGWWLVKSCPRRPLTTIHSPLTTTHCVGGSGRNRTSDLTLIRGAL